MDEYRNTRKVRTSTPRKRRRRKKKQRRGLWIAAIIAFLFLLLVIIVINIPTSKDKEEKSTAAVTTEYGSVVRPDGSIKVISDSVDRIDMFYTEVLQPYLSEYYRDHHKITEYSNDIVVVVWDDTIASDIDALRNNDSDAREGWEVLKKAVMDASKEMTYQLRGYAHGANVALVYVDARNHEDVLLVASNGALMYDFDIDIDLNPWYLYQNYNEEVKIKTPDL